jgi:hypothetical protein
MDTVTMAPDNFSYTAWLRRRRRRERLLRYGGALVAVALPCLIALVVIGWWLS